MKDASDEVRAELIEREGAWWRAIQVRDWDFVRSFMHTDFSITTAGWIDAPIARDAWLVSLDDRYELEAFDYDEFVVREHGDIAIVQCRSHQRGRMRDSGEAWSGTFRYTDVWLREAGDWRVLVRHAGMRR
jgi:ketosteroid isomerase-like protein